ncbi:MAG: GNAT family protein [Vagococcus sp.]|uniref:GNAT family N-acetyltransferase n=1 Tax=Vagococcus sp. TaxID=1933889 RepID=UPI002FC8994C
MFETNQIKLRKLEISDAKIYHQWRNDIDVMSSTSPELDQFTLEETESFIKGILVSETSRSYMIVTKDDNKTVGIISLININRKDQSAECIIDIGEKEKWGQKIGQNSLKLLMNTAFNEWNLHRLMLQVFSFNTRAISMYEKLGFQLEGTLREAFYRGGMWHDIKIMSILKSEYQKQS